MGRRGFALKSSLLKANWDGQTGGQAQVSIGMHAHPKNQICSNSLSIFNQLATELFLAFTYIYCINIAQAHQSEGSILIKDRQLVSNIQIDLMVYFIQFDLI
jgi:hypothetical protein